MRAHMLDAYGVILNTVMVTALADGMADADLVGGSIGDRVVDYVAIPAPVPPISDDLHNAAILAQLEAIDSKSIRPLREGDMVRVSSLEMQAAALRLQLRKG